MPNSFPMLRDIWQESKTSIFCTIVCPIFKLLSKLILYLSTPTNRSWWSWGRWGGVSTASSTLFMQVCRKCCAVSCSPVHKLTQFFLSKALLLFALEAGRTAHISFECPLICVSCARSFPSLSQVHHLFWAWTPSAVSACTPAITCPISPSDLQQSLMFLNAAKNCQQQQQQQQ